MYYSYLQSPIGQLLLAGTEASLSLIGFPEGKGKVEPKPDWEQRDDGFAEAKKQLQEYFSGDRKVFDLALAPHGTEFQLQVLKQLEAIPFGETRSYRQVAEAIGRPKAVRAVGAANGRNPLPIVIPCHRVIGADGSLTGFGGGLAAKSWLLKHEGIAGPDQAQLF